MELRQMQYVVVIAALGNMTRAAEKLHISQSALSLSYRSLERELGVTLFEKQGRTLALTQDGKVFCRQAEDILRQVSELQLTMEQRGDARKKRIVLASDAVDYASEAILRYEKGHPDLEFEQLRLNAEETLEALRLGQADLALTLKDVSSNTLASELLLKEPMYALVARDSPLADAGTLSITRLRGIPLITQQNGYAVTEMFHSFYEQAWMIPGRIVTIGDPETIVSQVRRGTGISFIPECVYLMQRKFIPEALDGCKAIPMEEGHCSRRVYLTTQKGKKHTQVCLEFMAFLRRFGAMTQEIHHYPNDDELKL